MMASKGKTPPTQGGDHDDVGYGKPPKRAQFKPGRSGNPRGRPKGTKNLKTDLLEELGEKILVHEGDQARNISKQRAVVKSLVARTLKGDGRAANTLMSMMMRLLDTGMGVEVEGTEDLHPDEIEIIEAFKQRLTRSGNNKKTGGRSRRSRKR